MQFPTEFWPILLLRLLWLLLEGGHKKVEWINFVLFHHCKRPNFFFKFDIIEVLVVENLHQKFGGIISKIADFFFYCPTFSGYFSVFFIPLKTEK